MGIIRQIKVFKNAGAKEKISPVTEVAAIPDFGDALVAYNTGFIQPEVDAKLAALVIEKPDVASALAHSIANPKKFVFVEKVGFVPAPGTGTNWVIRDAASSQGGWHSVCYGNGLFVSVANGLGTGNRVMTSGV